METILSYTVNSTVPIRYYTLLLSPSEQHGLILYFRSMARALAAWDKGYCYIPSFLLCITKKCVIHTATYVEKERDTGMWPHSTLARARYAVLQYIHNTRIWCAVIPNTSNSTALWFWDVWRNERAYDFNLHEEILSSWALFWSHCNNTLIQFSQPGKEGTRLASTGVINLWMHMDADFCRAWKIITISSAGYGTSHSSLRGSELGSSDHFFLRRHWDVFSNYPFDHSTEMICTWFGSTRNIFCLARHSTRFEFSMSREAWGLSNLRIMFSTDQLEIALFPVYSTLLRWSSWWSSWTYLPPAWWDTWVPCSRYLSRSGNGFRNHFITWPTIMFYCGETQ